jgi:hypothetical protein
MPIVSCLQAVEGYLLHHGIQFSQQKIIKKHSLCDLRLCGANNKLYMVFNNICIQPFNFSKAINT